MRRSILAILASATLISTMLFAPAPTTVAQAIHPPFAPALARLPAGLPMPVLVPSDQAHLFDDRALLDARFSADEFRAPGLPRYEITLVRPGEPVPTATFYGFPGSLVYAKALVPPDPSCDSGVAYCAYTGYVMGPPISERFAGLTVNGRPAVVAHGTCCNGEHWEITWYDAGSNATYGFSLDLDMAQKLGAQGVSPQNRLQAQRLADLVAGLIAVSR